MQEKPQKAKKLSKLDEKALSAFKEIRKFYRKVKRKKLNRLEQAEEAYLLMVRRQTKNDVSEFMRKNLRTIRFRLLKSKRYVKHVEFKFPKKIRQLLSREKAERMKKQKTGEHNYDASSFDQLKANHNENKGYSFMDWLVFNFDNAYDYLSGNLEEEIAETTKDDIIFGPIFLSATNSSLNSTSFLTSAGFQDTKRVLAKAAIEGKSDWFKGLKDCIIAGKMIPAGSAFLNYKNYLDNVYYFKDYFHKHKENKEENNKKEIKETKENNE
jgi:hypothetical protein